MSNSSKIIVTVYNTTGAKVGEQELNAAVFGVKVKPVVVHQAVVAQQANARVAIAHTKTKSEVRGGGKKPWKQKGTGRARQGSTRNPQWRGGGVTFGPRSNRNFSQKINKQVKQQALRMVLSDKVAHQQVVVVDKFTADLSKTKQMQALMKQLPVNGQRRLLVLGEALPEVLRSARNLMQTSFIAANSINVVDLLKHPYLVMDQAAVGVIEKVYSRRSTTPKK